MAIAEALYILSYVSVMIFANLWFDLINSTLEERSVKEGDISETMCMLSG